MTTRPFASFEYHMSLWEAAHRYAGCHPEETNENRLPVEVIDILKALMRAQIHSELPVVDSHGITLKDWTYISHWEDYVPYEEQQWDGTNEHLRELYLDYMHQVVKRHDDLIARHHEMLEGTNRFERSYLETVFVESYTLGKWALTENVAFPDFWFSAEEKEELSREFKKEQLIRSKTPTQENEDPELSQELHDQVLSDFRHSPDEDIAEVMFKRGQVSNSDIDLFWVRLRSNQKSRLMIREVASILWKDDPTLTIATLLANPVIQKYCRGSYFSGKDTLRNWVQDLDPRPSEAKPGKPRKS